MSACQEISELNVHRNSWEMCCAQTRELPYKLLYTVGRLLHNKVPFLKPGAEYCIAQSCLFITGRGLICLFLAFFFPSLFNNYFNLPD